MQSTPSLSLAFPIASGLACAAFAVSIVVGVVVDQPTGAILARSVTVMLVVWPAGLVLGTVLERIFREPVQMDVSEPSEGESTTEENNAFDFVDDVQVESDGSEVGAELVGTGS